MFRFVLAALLLLTAPATGNTIEPWRLNQLIDNTNFLINSGCSGTLIDTRENHILTAAHCILSQYETVEREKIEDGVVKKEKVKVAKPGTVSQIFYKGPLEVQKNSYIFKIIASDRNIDLALLKVETKLPSESAAPIACSGVIRTEPVYAVGNSFGVLYSTVTKGIVSSLSRSYRDLQITDLSEPSDAGENGLVQHSATIAPGNSGGALYNEQGELVGVNVRGMVGGFAFAVPLDDVKKFLANHKLERLWGTCK